MSGLPSIHASLIEELFFLRGVSAGRAMSGLPSIHASWIEELFLR